MFILSGITFFLGVFFAGMAGILAEPGGEPPIPAYISGVFWALFLLVSLILWVNEILQRQQQGSFGAGNLLSFTAWMLVLNIYGAYYYSIRRYLECRWD